jgi:hypothetical protein
MDIPSIMVGGMFPATPNARIRQGTKDVWRSKLHHVTATIVVCCALLAIVAFGLWTYLLDESPAVTLATGIQSDRNDLGSDQQLRRLAVGTWRDFYHGKRTLTIREDGTATMVIEFSGFKARLFTPRLQLDLRWSIEGGSMLRRTVGGRPSDKVDFVIKRVGDRVEEPILELTQSRMLLQDQSGSRQYQWQRIR